MKNKPDDPKQPAAKAVSERDSALAARDSVLRPGQDGVKLVRRAFPGPRMADAALRVVFERRANAELIAHAKESLDREVCGVLAGQICEDDEGSFVHVSAAIRGTAASEGSTHVTFTQATWNAIHQTLDRDYRDLKIVGWYHTHPGFGVEFSDMDLFIQQNFFSGAAQIAMVTDPLSGAVAIGVNTERGVRYLPRFWVDGREQRCRVPAGAGQAATSGAVTAGSAEVGSTELAQLEARVSQLIQATDEQRAWQHNFLLFCGFVFCIAVIAGVGYFIFKTYTSRLEPPRVNTMVPIPVQIGDKRILVGVALVEWDVPDELNAILLQEDMLRKEAEKKLAKETSSSTNSAAAGATKAGSPVTTNK